MAQLTDTSTIQRLIRRARLRIRGQWALEGATTATIIAAACALASIVSVRTQLVSPATGVYLLIGSLLIVIAGAVISGSRKLDDEIVARRIDRASNLADRLSTAIAFERTLGGAAPKMERASERGGAGPDETTHELMLAAISDGVRAAPRANLRAATPFVAPKDLRAALGFLAISALAAGLSLPANEVTPHVFRARPDHARPGAQVVIEGDNLMTGIALPVTSRDIRNTLGAPNVPAAVGDARFRPSDGSVFMGTLDKSRPVTVLDWTASQVLVQIPADAPFGDTKLYVFIAGKAIGAVDFTVVDPKDQRFHQDKAVAFEPDEKAYVEAIIAELKNVAQRDKVPELDEFAKKIEQLLDKAENGEITKEQLLDALAKAEDALKKDAEPDQAEVSKAMAEMGKELQKEQLTKELGQALEKNELEKAQNELEKLADKLDNKELSEKQKEELSKKLEQVAKQMEKQDKQKQDKQDQQQQKLQDEIRRLEKDKKDAKNEQQRQEMERRLEDKKRDLEKLQKQDDEKEQSAQRRALKRLEKDMEKAAENLQKPQKDPKKDQEQQDQEQQERDKEASRNLKDAARETGKVDKDQRKQATQKKLSSQMDDLREAMRRAKQKGNKGPNDPFNRQGKNQDFISRARGQKGSGQAWKPGQGPGQGQGQGKGQGQGQGQNGQPGGQGSGNGGDEWGIGHDDNLAGDPTAKTGNQKDADLTGKQGDKGGSTRETILAAAQKGFAGVGYKKVYADYQRIVEEVMRTEKLPSSYKYYVKRYFAKIHPNTIEGDAKPGEEPQPQ
ncbi:MAG: hypothetical protein JWO36_3871 [Myxococcales bacterium]|nr:hypothetical protein [Myxococcales bacterium]